MKFNNRIIPILRAEQAYDYSINKKILCHLLIKYQKNKENYSVNIVLLHVGVLSCHVIIDR